MTVCPSVLACDVRQATLERQDQLCMYPAHHDLESFGMLYVRDFCGQSSFTRGICSDSICCGCAGASHPQAGQPDTDHLTNPDEQAAQDGPAAAIDQHQQGGRDAGQGSSQQPPVAGNEGTHASVEPHEPHGVPDRLPAAVALQPSEDIAAAHSSQTERPATEGDKAGEGASELKKPTLVEQQQQQKGKASPTPVFVPIVVAMDAQDHKIMVEEWYSRQMVSLYMRLMQRSQALTVDTEISRAHLARQCHLCHSVKECSTVLSFEHVGPADCGTSMKFPLSLVH